MCCVDDSLLPWRLPRSSVSVTSEELGQGATSVVYLGRYDKKETVAVKQIKDEYFKKPEALKNFVEELKLMHRLKHPNIVNIIGAMIEYDPTQSLFPCMVMEAVDTNLRDALRGPPMSVDVKIEISRQLADALLYLRTRDPVILHCDVKPENIMMTKNGVSKLSDFGLAKQRSSAGFSKVTSLDIKGTYSYMVSLVFLYILCSYFL